MGGGQSGRKARQSKEQILQEILRARDPWVLLAVSINSPETEASFEVPPSRIIGSLYLGNILDMVSACSLPAFGCLTGKPIDTKNKQKFDIVVTVCPLSIIEASNIEVAIQELEASFSIRNISWYNVGRTLSDSADSWHILAHDCTFPESELALKPLPNSVADYETLAADKCKRIQAVDPALWFEPIFKVFDKGARHRGRILVHCQMGVSRSPALIAAYIIQRYRVTTVQAIAYIRTKRLFVNTKFTQALEEYQMRLGIGITQRKAAP